MVIGAVRAALENEPYKSRFAFSVHPFESEKGRFAQASYCFGRDRHGFVVLDRTGTLLACRPSHFYGQAEIESDLDKILRVGTAR
jgi:hypothetical protein